MRTSAIALSALATLSLLELCPDAMATPAMVEGAETLDHPNPTLDAMETTVTAAISPSAIAPPEMTPPEMTPPKVALPEMTPSGISPPAIASPARTASARAGSVAPSPSTVAAASTVAEALPTPLAPNGSLSQGGAAEAEPGTPPPQAEAVDPEDLQAELGEIRILEPAKVATATPPHQSNVQLLVRSSTFTSDNITALESFRRGDTVYYNSAVLLATPQLGPTTRLVATVGGGLVRYADRDESDYNLVTWGVGVQQRLAPGMYVQVGGGQDVLYQSGSGSRLLRDNALHVIVGRQDALGKRFRLDSAYNLRASFTNLDTQSQVSHSLGARLRYDITPSFQGAIDYRLTFKDFTETARHDTEHQVGATITYNINPRLFVAGSVSYLFGRSSNVTADLNNFSAGLSVGLNVPLF